MWLKIYKEFRWMYVFTGAVYIKMQQRFIQKYKK